MRSAIGTYEAFDEVVEGLASGGLLLTTGERGNPMTIGWGMLGRIWGKPVFTVLVRPSRFSFGLLEAHPEFVVNVPGKDLRKAVAICGSKSGRDIDKIAECGFTLGKGNTITVPHIEQCSIHFECRVVHKTNVLNADLDTAIVANTYATGDFHRIYHGEILGAYKEG